MFPRNMKTETIRLLIIFFILLPSLASILIPAGQPKYRLRERIEAMEAYTLNPSAATKAARDGEFARLHQHERTVGLVLIPMVLAIDGMAIYFFWNYSQKKHGPD